MAAPTKFRVPYNVEVTGSFLYRFSRNAISRIMTPMEAITSDVFMIFPATLKRRPTEENIRISGTHVNIYVWDYPYKTKGDPLRTAFFNL